MPSTVYLFVSVYCGTKYLLPFVCSPVEFLSTQDGKRSWTAMAKSMLKHFNLCWKLQFYDHFRPRRLRPQNRKSHPGGQKTPIHTQKQLRPIWDQYIGSTCRLCRFWNAPSFYFASYHRRAWCVFLREHVRQQHGAAAGTTKGHCPWIRWSGKSVSLLASFLGTQYWVLTASQELPNNVRYLHWTMESIGWWQPSTATKTKRVRATLAAVLCRPVERPHIQKWPLRVIHTMRDSCWKKYQEKTQRRNHLFMNVIAILFSSAGWPGSDSEFWRCSLRRINLSRWAQRLARMFVQINRIKRLWPCKTTSHTEVVVSLQAHPAHLPWDILQAGFVWNIFIFHQP